MTAWQTHGEQCEVYQVPIRGKALLGHTYKTAQAGELFRCFVRCERDSACKSCNFKHAQEICEMNNETKETKPNDFISDDQSYYIKCTGGDIGECKNDPSICDVNADCHNTDGSYICICKSGYTGDGKTCSIAGCPKHWPVIGNSCYYMTGETSPTINDAQNKCKQMSAKLPIIKSESENRFIIDLMSEQKPWVWLGMKRKQGKMVWFDDTPAEPLDGALYSAWNKDEPSSQADEICAYMVFYSRRWNDNKCDYTFSLGPYVVCQKEREREMYPKKIAVKKGYVYININVVN
ncbi:PREDICTED: neurocan core protein-like [Acropora digitifera]|uniref:neurocan core protein-like n=1 Tax=Acropora digitifera TaxID=70779 RepID=UPI00077A04EA|nr:PREDICTED: neurocan core protein-like [Acropora digitifera]